MKLKFAFVLSALVLAGCYQPPQERPVPQPTVDTEAPFVIDQKYRPEVKARMGQLIAETLTKRQVWADKCMLNKDIPMMFEADRATRCIRFSKEQFPNALVTSLLNSEFGGDLYPEAKQ